MAEPLSETIGRRILAARRQRGLRQAELARAIKISVTALAQIEKGKTPNPSRHVIQKIAQILRVRTDYLLGLTDDSRDEEPPAVTVVGSI